MEGSLILNHWNIGGAETGTSSDKGGSIMLAALDIRRYLEVVSQPS